MKQPHLMGQEKGADLSNMDISDHCKTKGTKRNHYTLTDKAFPHKCTSDQLGNHYT